MNTQQETQIRELWGSGMSVKDMAKAAGFPRWRVADEVAAIGLPPRWPHLADKAIDAPLEPIGDMDLDHDTAQDLWVAVLNQAVRDAVWWGNDRPKYGGAPWNLDWFDTRDAETVCERAGFDIEHIRPAVHDLRAQFLASCEAGRRPRTIVEMTQALNAAQGGVR